VARDARIEGSKALIVGLGNPGATYDRTRHNIGFLVVDRLAARWQVRWTEKKFKGVLGSGLVAGTPSVLLKPQTFMNLSGESVGPAAGFWRIPPGGVIALHDDIDLAMGQLRIKLGGGHGGHNGLRSMDAHLPSKEYFRVRLGVGRPARGEVTDWVLGRFGGEEQGAVEDLCERGCDAIEALLQHGLLEAQNRHHGPKPA
jgi:PTH1 family peptidyl-tRNA hydrolase